MSYVALWNATFSKPLINQAIAIIQRDQAAAIGIVNPALAPISEFHKGPAFRTAFPWLTLSADQTEFDSSSPLTRASHTVLSLALDAGQFDQEQAQDTAHDYARVLDVILTTATGADWTTPLPIVHETVPSGMTTASEPGSVKSVFVLGHRYALIDQKGIDAPVMRATVTVALHLQET